jgi:hypothetical protein
MIQSKGLNLNYWAESINCANYIVNHTPTKVLKRITPEEACNKIKPNVSHFHVFGSIAWDHIPDEKRKELQPLKVRRVYFLIILNMSKVIAFFNHIVMKLLLEEMLNLMKISWHASLIQRLFLLRPTIHLQPVCLILFLF